MQKSFYSSAIAVNNTIAATKLSDLTDTNIITPSNNQVLTFSGSKWINANSQSNSVSSVFGRVGAVVKNVDDYNITDIQNNSYLASDQNLTVSSPLSGQTIRYDGTKYLNSKLSIDDLSNTNIISPVDSDSLIYSSAGLGTWKNQKKYAELFDYVNVFAGATVTAVEKTIYFCNLATINFASAALGSIVKVINTNGPLLTMNFPGIILYFNDNNFNATLTTTDACEIVFEKILGNSWQVLSFTGKIFNSITNKNLANNDLNDLRNVIISTPLSGQVISWNGSNFINSSISSPVASVFGRTGTIVATEGDYNISLLGDVTITAPINTNLLKYNGSTWVNSPDYILKYNNYAAPVNSTLTAVVNTLYQSNNCTFNMPINPAAGDVITVFNIEPFTTTTINFGVSNGLYVFSQQNDGPISLSTTEVSAHITFICINSPTYWFIKDISGEWTNSIIPSKKITAAYIDINNMKNVNISSPSSGQFLTFDGSAWSNTTLEKCHPTSELYCAGNGVSLNLTLTTQNIWYQFSLPTTILNNPSANGVFARNNSNLLQWTYTGTNSKYYHSAFSLSSSSNDANDTFECAFFINNIIVVGSQFTVDYVQNNRSTSTAFHKVLLLNTNDIIDVRIRNISANGKIIASNNINLLAMACCSVN